VGVPTAGRGAVTTGSVGAGAWVPTAGLATTAAVVAMAATPPSVAPIDWVKGIRAKSGACESQESGPTTNRILPRESPTNARTNRGSNYVPALRTSSARAAAALAGDL
jgi:hypothetical protein